MHKARTLAELIPSYLDRPTKFEPGTKWEYCQSGINTLGRIIEIVSGVSYPDFIHQRILDPMGMKDATFYPTKEQIQRLAVSYAMKDGKLQPVKIALLPGPVGDRNHYAGRQRRIVLHCRRILPVLPDAAERRNAGRPAISSSGNGS